MSNEKPIIIYTALIPPTMAGRKNVTRRVGSLKEISTEPDRWQYSHLLYNPTEALFRDLYDTIEHQQAELRGQRIKFAKSRYQSGDILWVRETYCHGSEWDDCKPSEIDPLCDGNDIWYFADGDRPTEGWGKKRSSRFMPKWVARTWLEVVSVRVERLQDITDEDAEKEGCLRISTYRTDTPCLDHFPYLWGSINLKRGYSWESNPWVWRYEFKLVKSA